MSTQHSAGKHCSCAGHSLCASDSYFFNLLFILGDLVLALFIFNWLINHSAVLSVFYHCERACIIIGLIICNNAMNYINGLQF